MLYQFRSSAAVLAGTLVPLSMCVNISLVYLRRLAISAFLLSKAVANGYSLLSFLRLI